MNNSIRVIAFYLPQFHPIPENDKWWGKGFTEWTNVGKAKPLFKGHYQPKVPADLGYYDLRLPESRIAQANMAKEYGVEGFCYWHYWFGNGKELLERPFNEVLASGQPDFPFCLAWANDSWMDKQFSNKGTTRVLIEQLYPGDQDHINHFYRLLPAFKDHRYIRVDDQPLFMIYSPWKFPKIEHFIKLWQTLAKENGLKGIHFVAQTDKPEDISILKEKGFEGINIVRLFSFFKQDYSIIHRAYVKLMRVAFKRGRIIDYSKAAKYFCGEEEKSENCYPTIIPNWDHSPRSGRNGHILINSSPASFEKHVENVFGKIKNKKNKIVFLKSWNEWGEGNYIEPDLKFGLGYLEALKKEINK
jgi:hypothetical protein